METATKRPFPEATDLVLHINKSTPWFIQAYLENHGDGPTRIKVVNQQIRRQSVITFEYSDVLVARDVVAFLNDVLQPTARGVK